MKKHGIAQDTFNFPLDDEDEALGGPAWDGEDASRAGLSSGHT